jgi:glycerophosphoryl diester phosphodiesterase
MRAALRVPGCDGVEFDIRFSRDGVPVLLHDATLERVQGIPAAVMGLTAAELGRVGVPSLESVLAAVGREPFLDIELKALPNAAFLSVLAGARGTGSGSAIRDGIHRAAISSFDPEALAWVAARRPGWTRWLNAVELGVDTIDRARDLGCVAVAVLAREIDARGMTRARAAGLEVVAWTVRRRDTYDRLRRLGVLAMCVEGPALVG